MSRKKQDYVDGLRELADFLEKHLDLVPDHHPQTFFCPALSAKELASMVRQIGPADKFALDGAVGVVRKFGPHTLQVYALHEVAGCVRVEVGVEHVPAVAAHERVVYKWDCPPSFLKGGRQHA